MLRFHPFFTMLDDIELNCIYRCDDASPILHAFLSLVRGYRAARIRMEK